MPAPPVEHRVVRRDGHRAGERLDGLAELPRARLRDAQRDELVDVLRIGGQRRLCAGHGSGVGLRSILDAGWGAVLHRLTQCGGCWCAHREQGDD